MMDGNASQVKFANHLLGEEPTHHPKLTFNPIISTKTFLSQVIDQAIFSFHEFLIYLLKTLKHLHQAEFCESSYIF